MECQKKIKTVRLIGEMLGGKPDLNKKEGEKRKNNITPCNKIVLVFFFLFFFYGTFLCSSVLIRQQQTGPSGLVCSVAVLLSLHVNKRLKMPGK